MYLQYARRQVCVVFVFTMYACVFELFILLVFSVRVFVVDNFAVS